MILPTTEVFERKLNKRHIDWKGRNKTSFIHKDMRLCVEKSNESTKKLLKLTRECNEVVGYKVNIQKSIVFIYTRSTMYWKFLYARNTMKNWKIKKF